MTAATVILNIAFSALVIFGIVGLLAWAVVTDRTRVQALAARTRRHAHPRARHAAPTARRTVTQS